MQIFYFKVKSKALVLADLNSIHQKRIEDDERLKLEIEHVFKELQRYESVV